MDYITKIKLIDNWSIYTLMNDYNKAVREINDSDTGEIDVDSIKELYADAMKVLFIDGIGDVFVLNHFIDCVERGCITDYDGTGCFYSRTGEEGPEIQCDSEWLQKHSKDYPFVVWYNK